MMVQFGIWIFDERIGLIGRPEKGSEIYLPPNKIWEIKETRLGPVWKWPLHFARLDWFSPRVADNFNKAFFYAQRSFEGFRSQTFSNKFEIDAHTIYIQTEILSDHFGGPTEEIEPRKLMDI